jgi:hypothetical protein
VASRGGSRATKGRVKASLFRLQADAAPLEVQLSGHHRRFHPGFLRQGQPFVDDATAVLNIKHGPYFEVTLFGPAADLRAIAAAATEAADALEQAPVPCPGGCGYGCAPASQRQDDGGAA